MSVVRPEFGPTLAELVRPRVRALPFAARLVVWAAVAALLVALVLGALRLRSGEQRTAVVVREPVAFNLTYPEGLRRVAPRPGEALRLASPADAPAPQSFAVAPMRLDRYRGDVTAVLMGRSPRLIEHMRATLPGFVWRGDGRVNYNRQPGYEILFQARIDGRTWYGRRTLLVPGGDEPPREGVDIMIMAARSEAIPRVDAVASATGALKTAIRSFRFGTERP
jgi:hypothetical protein